MFDGKYQQLNKNGTFGWTKLTYVGEIKEKKQAGPSFGLMARLFLDRRRVAGEGRRRGRADRGPGARHRGSADRAAENAEAYRRAFPKGPPFFTGASSLTGSDRNDPRRRDLAG